jgi:uncharacterized membrane protein (UPF0127 family)
VRARVIVSASGHVLADRARWATTAADKRRGLIGSPPLLPGEGLIIDRAFQVHTFGMGFSIDVVFCNKRWIVKHVVRSMSPRRVSKLVPGARYALELPAGTVPLDLERGDGLTYELLSER